MSGERIFDRLEILTGPQAMAALGQTSVVVFGLGGVGSWAAEGLVRSGVGQVTLVDNDLVDETNINRQVQAHLGNVGAAKTEELRDRLHQINPGCSLTPIRKFYCPENAHEFPLASFDYVLDCIDSVENKVELLIRSVESGSTVFSSMGAAFKLDPTFIRCGSIWTTEGCALARVIRRKLRARGFTGDFRAVFSPESVEVTPRTVNGSAVFVTACFGMALAGLVVRDVVENCPGSL